MSLLIKSNLFVLGLATTGAGFIGSNYLFQKKKDINLKEEKNDEEWDKKLELLLTKLEKNNLASKINAEVAGNDDLAINSGNKKEFKNKEKAKKALKAWCKKENKEVLEKENERELCKETKLVNWLFG